MTSRWRTAALNRKVYIDGDDFSARGRKPDLDWYETGMQEALELTVKGRLGYTKEDHHELCILNRVLRTCSRGVEYEADPRHVEELIRSMELVGVQFRQHARDQGNSR